MRRLKGIYILGTEAFRRTYGPKQRAEIESLVDVVDEHHTAESIKQHLGLLEEVDVIFSGWGAPLMDDAFLARAPMLRAVFYGAGSIRTFTTDAFWRRGIVVTSAYAANAIPVAEYSFATILLSLKHFWHFSSSLKRERRYPPHHDVPGAYESTVGLVSLGAIGRLVRDLLRSVQVSVLAYDPYVQPETAEELGVELVPLLELFRRADVVSVHTPSLAETKGMITVDHFDEMKSGGTFINTARGDVIAEGALIQSLKHRSDLYAVLDVTHPEPPEPGSPLYSLPNVMLTPHIAGSMNRECQRMGQYMVEELQRYLAGQPLRWAIDSSHAALMA
jgi:phosphoglycerate dehydrogenase-like enzyme